MQNTIESRTGKGEGEERTIFPQFYVELGSGDII